MAPSHLTLRLNNLPLDITRPRLENQIRRIAENRNCSLWVGPIVNVDNISLPRTASTTITVRGDGRIKVVDDLRGLLVGSLTEQREAHADAMFYGPTVLAANKDSFLDFYFIHGLGGHAVTSWASEMQNSDPSTVKVWPRDFLPAAFERNDLRGRFVTLGYNANLIRRADATGTLRSFAENLLSHLLADRPKDSAAAQKPFYFVCHSLGGLVVCQALLLLLSENERTSELAEEYRHLFLTPSGCLLKGIVFLGTPFQGSLKANQIRPFAKALALVNPFPMNTDILSILKNIPDGTSPLDPISTAASIVMNKRNIQFLVACETLPMTVGRSPVVVRSSAEGPFQDRRIHITINANHVNMVKFDNETNTDYHQLESRIIQMVKQQSPRPTSGQDNSSNPRLSAQSGNRTSSNADPIASRPEFDLNRSATEPLQNNRNNTIIYNVFGGFPANGDVRNSNVHNETWRGRGSPHQSPHIVQEPEPVSGYGGDTSRQDASNRRDSGDQNPHRQSTLRVKSPEAAGRSDKSTFSRLGRFDTVFIIDDTSSMQGPVDSEDNSDWPLDKWTVLEECLQNIVDIAATHDEDGVDVQFLKAKNMAQKNIKDPGTILAMLKSIRPRLESDNHRGTFFHQELIRAIDPVLWEYRQYVDDRKRGIPREHPKPLNLIVITDGDADDQDEVEDYLTGVAKQLDRLEAPGRHIGIQFVQIGDDEEAAAWLTDLDDGFKSRGIRDMIDTTPFDKQSNDSLTQAKFKHLLQKILLAAVTKKLDAEHNEPVRHGRSHNHGNAHNDNAHEVEG